MRIIISALLSVLLVTVAAAQTAGSQLNGTITDSSGSAVPGADITATLVDSGVSTKTVSNGLGYYTFPALLPGNYKLLVSKQGFQQLIRSGVTLVVGQTTTADLKLTVGQITQNVVVTATVPLLESSDSSLGGVMEQRRIQNMPLNGMDPYQLVALLPGVQPQGGFDVPRVLQETTYESNFTTNGSASMTNDTLIDGIPNMVGFHGQMAWTPSVDTVEEFRVLSSTPPAQFGRSGGGVVNIATKSGTNHFHGDLYEFLRNTVLDANNYFSNQNGIPRGALVFNMFGGSVGGPILRNRTFFFFSYEGQRVHQAQTFVGTVPTVAQRAGDFSQTENSAGQPIVIYNPFSTQQTASGYTRTSFPENKIPAGMIDPVAQKVLTYYPLPTGPGQGPSGVNNYSTSDPLVNGFGTWDLRIDQTFSAKDSMFGRVSYDDQTAIPANFFNDIATSDSFGPSNEPDWNVGLAETHTFGPNTLLQLRVGFARNGFFRTPESNGMDLTTLGFSSSFNSMLQDRQFPDFSIANMSQLGSFPVANYQLASQVYFASAAMTRVQGRHNLLIGGEFRNYLTNSFTGSEVSPIFSFNAGFTQGPNPLVSSSISGTGFASFLLGTPASGIVAKQFPQTYGNRYYAAYTQDDYRTSRRLTLNLGLRYSFSGPRTDRFNALNWMNFDVANPIGQLIGLPNLKGGLEYAGVNGNPRNLWNPSYDNLAPRFGFAYTLQPQMVVRGGFGIMFLPQGTGHLASGSQFGFSSTTNMVSSLNGVTPTNTLSNPFPQGEVATLGSSQGLLSGIGQSITILPRNFPVPNVQMYNLNIQRELPGSILVEAAYVGSHGIHLIADQNWDQLPDQDLSLGNALLATVPNPFQNYVSNGTYSAATIQHGYLLRPYPQYSGLSSLADAGVPRGNSSYNSFQVRADRRFSSGLAVFVSYTNAKLITDAMDQNQAFAGDVNLVVQDFNNFRAERGISPEDVSQRLVVSYMYPLPFGHGKRWFGTVSSPVEWLIGGWRVAGIATFQTGFPLGLSTSVNDTNSYGGGSRPNTTGQNAALSTSKRTIKEWFNTSVFSQPAPFTFGNVGPTLGNVRMDGAHNFDLSLFKDAKIGEWLTLEFHADAFNAFNTPQFSYPGTSFGTSQFGIVSSQFNNPRELQLGLKLSF